jgi:hypothetical protein
MPQFKTVKIGVWEDSIFIGVVIFSNGASSKLPKPYGLTMQTCCELTRVALTNHKTEVSRIVSIALKFLKKSNPGLRLVVSFADPHENHNGGIYQAMGWIYSGVSATSTIYYNSKGEEYHPRNVGSYNGYDKFGVNIYKSSEMTKEKREGKYRYLMPLDEEMRKRIEPLRKPYPKRATSETNDTLAIHAGKGGAAPTVALHI